MNATANRAYEIATTIFGKTEDQARQLYILGLLHDVGYAFDPADHAHAGGRVLADLGFTTDAVYDHGDPNVGFMDDELLIVNAADMTTSPTGAPMRMDEMTASATSENATGPTVRISRVRVQSPTASSTSSSSEAYQPPGSDPTPPAGTRSGNGRGFPIP